DVRQLLDHGAARRTRLVQAFPRLLEARIRGALPEGGQGGRDAAGAGIQQSEGLSRAAGEGVEGGGGQRNVGGGAGRALAAAGAGGQVEGVRCAKFAGCAVFSAAKRNLYACFRTLVRKRRIPFFAIDIIAVPGYPA